ncbi:beta strand repeat-containing protein [Flagellimonas sp.]|uniref:beta strand repeat-containing protein n=1 Tax=Flagellimonas sp. TaxID=2058762 RepID=UPI003BABCC8F
MKTYIVYLVIGLVAINSLSAQVKIGDNPQNLNPASLLELQSSNRVLVITRVTDAQMSGISPLPGAVVYNTDQGCLHYYNGTEWINICEELDNSFTVSTRADSLQQVNPNARDNTIAILESINLDGSTNYNFEVNRITGANIVDTSINGSTKLQNESVTNNKLAEKSVGLRNLADATNTGDLLMYNGTAWNFVNRTDLLNTQLDSIVGNEVVGPTDATLIVNGAGSQADPLTLDVAEGGITAFEIATDAVTTDEILNGNILTEDISDDAVTTVKIIDGAVTNAKLDKANIPLSGFAAAAANIDLDSNRIIDVGNPADAQDAATKAYVDALDGTDDQDLGTGTGGTPNESVELTITDGASTTIDIRDADSDITNEIQNIEEVLADGNNANGAVITGLGTPTAASDAATKAYVDALDGTDDQDLGTGTGGTPNESVELTITDGASTTIDIRDADSDITNEIQNIEEVLADGNNANGAVITGLGTPTAASDAATKAYVDALDGTDDQDLGTGTGGTPNESVELTITDGASTTIDIRDADSDTTNEIQNIEEVLADGNNANGAVITGLGTPTAASDAATKAYVDALDGTDDQDLGTGTGGTPNESVELTITDGASTTIDIRDADSDTTNEIQNIEEVLADGNNANGAVITGLGTPTAASDAATKAYVDSVTDEIALTGQVASGTSTSTGEYTINNAAITTTSIIQLTVQENASGNPIIIQLTNQDTAEFSVKIFEFQPAPTLVDANWQYIVVNP